MERFNQTITRLLQKNLYDKCNKKWHIILEEITYNYNISIHSATQKSPFTLFYNRNGFNTITFNSNNVDYKNFEFENTEQENICSINGNYLKRMDRNALTHRSKYSFEVNDVVLVKKDFDNNTKTKKIKLDSFFEIPSVVEEILSNNRLKISNKNGSFVVKNNQCKKIQK